MFLSTLPSRRELTLNDHHLELAVKFRLGLPLPGVNPNSKCDRCPLLSNTPEGTHAFSCKSSAGRVTRRHTELINTWRKVILQAGFKSAAEPRVPSLTTNTQDCTRADIVFADNANQYLLDISVTHPCTPSYMHRAAHSDGATARLRETSKTRKYANIPDRDPSFQFTPIVIETYGRLGNQSIQFIDTLTKSGKEAHPQALDSLPNLAKRTISVCIQRENAKMLANYRASCIVGHCPQKALQHCLIAG
jgi:hypothetical protein